MRKKVCAIILAGCLALGMAGNTTVYAAGNLTESVEERAESEGDFEYRDDGSGNEVIITRYTGSDTNLVTPGTLGGKPVTGIGEHAFTSCDSLISVTITSGVTSIGDHAFSVCDNLISISIPSEVVSIGYGIGSQCESLAEINVDSGNSAYFSEDGVLYDKNKMESIKCPLGKKGTVSIPSGVTVIGAASFWGCSGLTGVTIPSSVTEIGMIAFEYCIGLTNVTIPSSVTKLESRAFAQCKGLTDVTILSGMAKFGLGVFHYADYELDDEGNYKPYQPLDLTIHCIKGSTAEAYAKVCGHKYDYIESQDDVNIESQKVAITLNGQTVKGTLKVKVNKSYKFKAAVEPADATDKTVTWSTSNKKVATVKNGKVTIKKTGNATITAKTANGKTAKIKLKALDKAVKVTKVKVDGNKTMKVKEKQTLTLKVNPATADNTKVTWSSSNKKIATVSKSGKVVARKKGTVTITATAKDGSKKKGSIKIKIK